MTARRVVRYIATCDVCAYEHDEASGWLSYCDTPEEAIAHATQDDPETAFVLLTGGRLACPKTDAAHDTARRDLALLPGQMAIA